MENCEPPGSPTNWMLRFAVVRAYNLGLRVGAIAVRGA